MSLNRKKVLFIQVFGKTINKKAKAKKFGMINVNMMVITKMGLKMEEECILIRMELFMMGIGLLESLRVM